MILCFTGTGNSLHIADGLARRLNDEVVSLNNVIKNNQERKFVSEKPFVVVAPIYAWRLPRIIEELLPACTFEGSKDIYFVPTMGSETGKADEYCAEICRDMGMEFKGLCGVPMPDNYVVAYKVADDEKIKTMLQDAKGRMDCIAQAIKSGISIQKTDKTSFSGIKSGIINKLFVKFATSDKNYKANDECISCGLCEMVCPVNNIQMENGKPAFKGNCVACYSCIHRCPKAAINIGNKTQDKGRYICPESVE
ncbi:MAG: EFR1 family ferrodoxin [Treponema sp.]|nr:EFR1 family ferrodoxin [Treponema sp.]